MTYELRSIALAGALLASSAVAVDQLPAWSDPPLTYAVQEIAGQTGQTGQTVLAYDPAGSGRVVVAVGDLATASHVAVFVPGASWNAEAVLDSGRAMSPRDAARTLLAEVEQVDPTARVAAIAWLGYHPPTGANLDALRSERAIAGAPELVRLLDQVPAAASTTLICHSYGTVVCAHAAPAVEVDHIVAVGAAGMDAAHVDDLGTTARVWAALTADDGMRRLPPLRIAGLGHGTPPTAPAFGARVFGTGDAAGHSRYYEPGGETMRNLAAIVLGRTGEVTAP